MAEGLINGGGGTDTSVVTAAAGDVKKDKVIVNADGDSVTGTLALSGDAGTGNVLETKTFYNNSWSRQTGTMKNNGAVSGSVDRNKSYTIPAGYHDGSGVVKGPTMTDKAATTFRATTSDQTIAAGIYTTGIQTFKKVEASGLSANNILKGTTITISSNGTNIWSVAGSNNVLFHKTLTGRNVKTGTCNVQYDVGDWRYNWAYVDVAPGITPVYIAGVCWADTSDSRNITFVRTAANRGNFTASAGDDSGILANWGNNSWTSSRVVLVFPWNMNFNYSIEVFGY